MPAMFMRNIQYQVTLKIKHSGITARINPLIQGIEDNNGDESIRHKITDHHFSTSCDIHILK